MLLRLLRRRRAMSGHLVPKAQMIEGLLRRLRRLLRSLLRRGRSLLRLWRLLRLVPVIRPCEAGIRHNVHEGTAQRLFYDGGHRNGLLMIVERRRAAEATASRRASLAAVAAR